MQIRASKAYKSCNPQKISHDLLILDADPLKVLVNMFNSVLSTTPSEPSGLTALALWILFCIIFVFIALFFYVMILVKMKRQNRKTDPVEPMHEEDEEEPKKPCSGHCGVPDDLDPLFLFIHFVAFGLFVLSYFCAYPL